MHLPFCCRILLFLSFPVRIPQLLIAPVQHENPGKRGGKWQASKVMHPLFIYQLLWRNLAKPINAKAPWLKNVLNFSVPWERILHHTTSVQPNSSTELASLAYAGRPALVVIGRTDSSSLCHSFIYLLCFILSHAPLNMLCCPEPYLPLIRPSF